RASAKEAVGPYGFGGPEIAADAAGGPAPGARADSGAKGAAPAAPDGERAPDYSGTNTHEAGVDEPDLVKTDGKRIVTISGRVVVRSAPRLLFPNADRPLTEAQRTAVNEAYLDGTTVDDWLPRYTVDDTTGHHTGRVDCTSVSRPARYTGSSMLTVLTFDLAKPALGTGDPVTIVADGSTVYGTGPSLYVAGYQERELPRMQ